MTSRIVGQEVRFTTANDRDYELKINVTPVIPALRGQHFAAKPVSLVSLHDKHAISTGRFLDSFGVTEEHAARSCSVEVEQFLMMRTKRA